MTTMVGGLSTGSLSVPNEIVQEYSTDWESYIRNLWKRKQERKRCEKFSIHVPLILILPGLDCIFHIDSGNLSAAC